MSDEKGVGRVAEGSARKWETGGTGTLKMLLSRIVANWALATEKFISQSASKSKNLLRQSSLRARASHLKTCKLLSECRKRKPESFEGFKPPEDPKPSEQKYRSDAACRSDTACGSVRSSEGAKVPELLRLLEVLELLKALETSGALKMFHVKHRSGFSSRSFAGCEWREKEGCFT